VLILAFDTATDVATSALVRDGELLGERASRAVALLADVDDLLGAAALAAVLLLSAAPLRRYYRTPKQDFTGAAQALDRLAAPSDTRIAVYVAASVLNEYYHKGYVRVDSLAQLRAQEGTGRRLLVVTTLERVLAATDRELYDHIRSTYRRVAVLPATVGDGEMRIYEYAARAPN
jgi:hypothetical protein